MSKLIVENRCDFDVKQYRQNNPLFISKPICIYFICNTFLSNGTSIQLIFCKCFIQHKHKEKLDKTLAKVHLLL